jgi:hypothetical protein
MEIPIQFNPNKIANPAGLFGLTVDEARRQDGIAIDRPVRDMLQNLFPLELEHIQRHGPLDEEIAQATARYKGLAGEKLSTALLYPIKAGGVL